MILPEGVDSTLHLDPARVAFGDTLAGGITLPPGIGLGFLCFTNRSGSNHLADLLAASGRLNRAAEIFNAEEIIPLQQRFAFRSLGHLVGSLAQWNAVEGRFLAKLGLTHLPLLDAAGLLGPLLGHARFILIEREDKLAQAISLDIARQTRA